MNSARSGISDCLRGVVESGREADRGALCAETRTADVDALHADWSDARNMIKGRMVVVRDSSELR